MKREPKIGTLMGFEGQRGSGIAHLLIQDNRGVTRSIPCENGPTMRALLAMFGDAEGVIAALGSAEVKYTIGDYGLLESIGLAD